MVSATEFDGEGLSEVEAIYSNHLGAIDSSLDDGELGSLIKTWIENQPAELGTSAKQEAPLPQAPANRGTRR